MSPRAILIPFPSPSPLPFDPVPPGPRVRRTAAVLALLTTPLAAAQADGTTQAAATGVIVTLGALALFAFGVYLWARNKKPPQ